MRRGKRAGVPSSVLAAGPVAHDRRLVALGGACALSVSASSVPRLELASGSPAPSLLRGEELLRRKDGPSRQHVKHRAPDFVREN